VQLLSEDSDDGRALVGIASRDSVEQMQAFVDRHGLDEVVNVADPDGEVWARFGVFGQPTWAYVDGDTGQVTVRFGGLGEQGVLDAFEADGL
jgi:peroxiredoxin